VLQVGDELLEINGNLTESMLQSDVVTIIKQGRNVVRLTVRRLSTPTYTNDCYSQDNINSFAHSKRNGNELCSCQKLF